MMLSQRIISRRAALVVAVMATSLAARSAVAVLVVHFDPNDLSTQFTDPGSGGGTVPVSGIGDNAAFVTDVRSLTPGAPLDTFIDGENTDTGSPEIIYHSTQGTVWSLNGNQRLLTTTNDRSNQDGFGTQVDVNTMTLIVAGRFDANGADFDYLFDIRDDAGDGGTTVNANDGFALRYNHSTGMLEGVAKQSVNASVAMPAGEWFVATYAWDGVGASATLTVDTISGISVSDTAAAETSTPLADRWRVGARADNADELLGNMGDFMLYNDVDDHSAVAAQLVIDYLNIPELLINRSTGEITITNNSGSDITNVIGYSMTSASGTLDPSQWLTIDDNYDVDFPGLNQVDPDNDWTVLTNPNVRTDLSETEFEGNGASGFNGADFLDGASTSLGNAWIQYYGEDVQMELLFDNGDVLPLDVRFTGNGGTPFKFGDLDFDGDVDEDDFNNEFLPNYGADTSALVSGAERYGMGDMDESGGITLEDFILLNNAYLAANPGAASLTFGAVPEPTTSAMLLMAIAGLVLGRPRRLA